MRNFVNYINFTYTGGMNDTATIDQILPTEAVLLQNGYIRNQGKFQKRSGTLLVGDDTGSTAIVGQTAWTTPSGTKYFLRMTGTNLQYLNGSTWTTMDSGFTTGLPTEFVAGNGKLYIFNGTENTHSWDGAATTLNACLTDMGSTIPTGKYAVYWKNYMFVWGGAKQGGTTYKSRCYFSGLGDPDSFTHATDYFDVNLKDGFDGTGIYGVDKFLVLGKERSVNIMTGSNPSEWKLSASVNNLVIIENSIGVASHRSMIQVGDDIWYMGTDGMIHSIRRNEQGATPLSGIVSNKVRTTLGNMNMTHIGKVAATQFNGRVYFAFPNTTSTYNNKVLVCDTSIVTEDTYNPHPWVVYTGWNPAMWTIYTPSSTPQLYYGEASADSLTFQAETGDIDNDSAIDFDYKSGMIDLQKRDEGKTFRFLIASGQSGGNYDISISSSIDGETYTTVGTLNLSSGVLWNSGVWDTSTWGFSADKRQKYPLNIASKKLQLRFRNNAASQPVSIYGWTLAIKQKKVK